MGFKIFVCSEMNTQEDIRRRNLIKREIIELGHIPIMFEEQPNQPLADGEGLDAFCRGLVRDSDVYIGIIDDTITNIMISEFDEARRILGERKMLFFFKETSEKDERVEGLWNFAKKHGISTRFSTQRNLKILVKKSIAHLGIRSSKMEEITIMNDIIDVIPDQDKHFPHLFENGDSVSLVCTADTPFFAGIFNEADFKRLYGPPYGFTFGTDKVVYTETMNINKKGFYYLVLRRTGFALLRVKINVEWKVTRKYGIGN